MVWGMGEYGACRHHGHVDSMASVEARKEQLVCACFFNEKERKGMTTSIFDEMS